MKTYFIKEYSFSNPATNILPAKKVSYADFYATLDEKIRKLSGEENMCIEISAYAKQVLLTESMVVWDTKFEIKDEKYHNK